MISISKLDEDLHLMHCMKFDVEDIRTEPLWTQDVEVEGQRFCAYTVHVEIDGQRYQFVVSPIIKKQQLTPKGWLARLEHKLMWKPDVRYVYDEEAMDKHIKEVISTIKQDQKL